MPPGLKTWSRARQVAASWISFGYLRRFALANFVRRVGTPVIIPSCLRESTSVEDNSIPMQPFSSRSDFHPGNHLLPGVVPTIPGAGLNPVAVRRGARVGGNCCRAYDIVESGGASVVSYGACCQRAQRGGAIGLVRRAQGKGDVLSGLRFGIQYTRCLSVFRAPGSLPNVSLAPSPLPVRSRNRAAFDTACARRCRESPPPSSDSRASP